MVDIIKIPKVKARYPKNKAMGARNISINILSLQKIIDCSLNRSRKEASMIVAHCI